MFGNFLADSGSRLGVRDATVVSSHLKDDDTREVCDLLA